MRTRWIGIVAMLMAVMGCRAYYLAPDFESATAEHMDIAVLPAGVTHNGLITPEISTGDLALILEAESRAFQIAMHQEILRSAGHRDNNIRVQLQPHHKTWNVLQRAEIGPTDISAASDIKMAELLNVDAVVRISVFSTRFLSDIESFGVDLSIHLAELLAEQALWPWLPPHITRAKKINAEYSLISQQGELLWSISFDHDSDWRHQSEDIIEWITRKAASKFPYRSKSAVSRIDMAVLD